MKEIKKLEDNMPIAVLTSKGQMTIPKEVRKALDLKPSGKVVIVVDGDQAILKPLIQLWDVVDKLKYYHRSNFVLKIRNLLKLVNNAPHFSYSEKDVWGYDMESIIGIIGILVAIGTYLAGIRQSRKQEREKGVTANGKGKGIDVFTNWGRKLLMSM